MEDENEPQTSEPATTTERAGDSAKSILLPVGIGIAVAIGTGIGVLIDNRFLGIGVGLLIGALVVGIAMARRDASA